MALLFWSGCSGEKEVRRRLKPLWAWGGPPSARLGDDCHSRNQKHEAVPQSRTLSLQNQVTTPPTSPARGRPLGTPEPGTGWPRGTQRGAPEGRSQPCPTRQASRGEVPDGREPLQWAREAVRHWGPAVCFTHRHSHTRVRAHVGTHNAWCFTRLRV